MARARRARILEAPAIHVAPLAQIEGTEGRRVRTFRTTGTPFVAVELQVARGELTIDIGERTPLPRSQPVLAAAAAWARLVHGESPARAEREPLLRALLRTLVAERILARDLAATRAPRRRRRGRALGGARAVRRAHGVAVLLLSNPEVELIDVARRSGYSSPEALSHALTAEGLPPPLELRRRLIADAG